MTENDNNIETAIRPKEQLLKTLLGQKAKEIGLSDILEIQKGFNDPVVLSALIFKLMEERSKTNTILEEINRKYDDLQFLLKNKNLENINSIDNLNNSNQNKYEIFSETDDKIINYIKENGKADAQQITEKLNYKATNGASQRLNNLVKLNYLKKIQAGRKVYFVIR
ncbi:MAG: hypothetical protein V1824_03535 [archaeon]